MQLDESLSRLHGALGHKRLHRSWAKVEIILGLLAAGLGVFVGNGALYRFGETAWLYAAGGLFLFVLGGYLAMAGHRSHLYQSMNELAAYLAEEMRSHG
jgi:hypothetical protein